MFLLRGDNSIVVQIGFVSDDAPCDALNQFRRYRSFS